MDKTYIIHVSQKHQTHARELSRYSGRIYSKVVSTIYKLKQNKDIWLSKNNMEKLIRLYAEDFPLHSQSKQGTVQQYYHDLKSFFKNRESNPQAKPPYRSKKYFKVIYKKSAISYNNNILTLNNGRQGKYLKIKINDLKKTPKYAELLYNTYQEKYEVHIVVEVENKHKSYEDNDKILAIDLTTIDESYTSQTCPVCGSKNKTNNRNYICSECDFKYHRDGVGAINIYRKYTAGTLKGDKSDWLEGVLTSPYGLRYQSEAICCRTGWSISAFNSAG